MKIIKNKTIQITKILLACALLLLAFSVANAFSYCSEDINACYTQALLTGGGCYCNDACRTHDSSGGATPCCLDIVETCGTLGSYNLNATPPPVDLTVSVANRSVPRPGRHVTYDITLSNIGTRGTGWPEFRTYYAFSNADASGNCPLEVPKTTDNWIGHAQLGAGSSTTYSRNFIFPDNFNKMCLRVWINPTWLKNADGTYYAVGWSDRILENNMNNNNISLVIPINKNCTTSGWSMSFSPNPVLIGAEYTPYIYYNNAGGTYDCAGETLYGSSNLSPVIDYINDFQFTSNPKATNSLTAPNSPTVNLYHYLYIRKLLGSSFIDLYPSSNSVGVTRCTGNINLIFSPNPVTYAGSQVTANVFMGSTPSIDASHTTSGEWTNWVLWYPRAQKFKITTGDRGFNGVELVLGRPSNCIGSSNNVRVTLTTETDTGTIPNTSNVLAEGSMTIDKIPIRSGSTGNNSVYTYIPFSQTVLLSANTNYWIVVEADGCGDGVAWASTSSGTVSPATATKKWFTAGSWSHGPGNHNFKVHTFIPGVCKNNETFIISSDSDHTLTGYHKCTANITEGDYKGSCTFSSPTATGVYNHWAFINKTGSGLYNQPGENTTAALGVEVCSGSFFISSSSSCYPGNIIFTFAGSSLTPYCLGDTVYVRYGNSGVASFGPITGTAFTSTPFSTPIALNNLRFRPAGTYADGNEFPGTYTFEWYIDSGIGSTSSTIYHSLILKEGKIERTDCGNDICYDYHGYPVCCTSAIKVIADILNTGPQGNYDLTLNVTPISEECNGCEEINLRQLVPGFGNQAPFFGFEDVFQETNCSYNLSIILPGTPTGYADSCMQRNYNFYGPCVKYEPFKKWREVSLMSLPMHFFYAIRDSFTSANFLADIPSTPACCDPADDDCTTNKLFRSGLTFACCPTGIICSCQNCLKHPSNLFWCNITSTYWNFDTAPGGPYKYLFGSGWLGTAFNNVQGIYTASSRLCNDSGIRYTAPANFSAETDKGTIPETGGCIEGNLCQYDTYRILRHKYNWEIEYDMSVNTYLKDEYVPMYIGNNMLISMPVFGKFTKLSTDICSGDGNLCYTEIPLCGDGICDTRSGEKCWNCPDDCGCSITKTCSMCNTPGFTDSKGCATSFKQHGETCTCEVGECDKGLSCKGLDETGMGHCCYDKSFCPTAMQPCAEEEWDSVNSRCYVPRNVFVKNMSLNIRDASDGVDEMCDGNICSGASMRQTVADFDFTICNHGAVNETVDIKVMFPVNDVIDNLYALSGCTEGDGRLSCPPTAFVKESARRHSIVYNNTVLQSGKCYSLDQLSIDISTSQNTKGFGGDGNKERLLCVHPNTNSKYDGISGNYLFVRTNNPDRDGICTALNRIGGLGIGALTYNDGETILNYCRDCSGEICVFKPSTLALCSPYEAQYCSAFSEYSIFSNAVDDRGENVIGTPIMISVYLDTHKTLNGHSDNPIRSYMSGGFLSTESESKTSTFMLCDTMNAITESGASVPSSKGHTCMIDSVQGVGNFNGSGFFGDPEKTYGPFYTGATAGYCNKV